VPLTVDPLLINVPLLALDELKKPVSPFCAPLTWPPLLTKVPLPAFDVPVNCVMPPN